MGGTSSKNTLKNMVKASLGVLNEHVSNCAGGAEDAQINKIILDCEGDIILDSIDLKNRYVINARCFDATNFDSDLQQKLEESLKQQAESISQQISLNFGRTEADNYTENIIDLSTQVKNIIVGNCANQVSKQINQFIAKSRKGRCISTKPITFENVKEVYAECVSEAAASTKAGQSLQLQIDQVAKAKQESMLAFLAVIAAIIGILLAGGGTAGVAVLTNKNFVIGGVSLLAMYWFFPRKSESKEDKKKSKDETMCKSRDETFGKKEEYLCPCLARSQ